MVLVDTSVWVAHLRKADSKLQHLLSEEMVLCHPFIIGEIACGHLNNRKEILSLLQILPSAIVSEEKEILHFIESKQLFGMGIGFVDAHLLASTLLSKAQVWTNDHSFKKVASKLGIVYL